MQEYYVIKTLLRMKMKMNNFKGKISNLFVIYNGDFVLLYLQGVVIGFCGAISFILSIKLEFCTKNYHSKITKPGIKGTKFIP